MPTEDELRAMLRSSDAPHSLDAARIIAKSRARRIPRQVAAGAVGVLAVAGIGVLAVPSFIQPPQSATISDQALIAEGGAGDSELNELKRAPAELLNPCGAPVADTVPSATGLELTVDFPAAVAAGTAAVDGVVRMTNTSDSRVSGTTAAVPALTLAEDGITVWRSNGPMILSLVVVDLEPGESLEYPASVELVRCDATDEGPDGFRSDLPALAAGTYEVSAAIDLTLDEPSADAPALAELVTGPRESIVLE